MEFATSSFYISTEILTARSYFEWFIYHDWNWVERNGLYVNINVGTGGKRGLYLYSWACNQMQVLVCYVLVL